ncbi:MAG: hypothetical protein R3D25_11380 [Geminicoccaceae bacterium]
MTRPAAVNDNQPALGELRARRSRAPQDLAAALDDPRLENVVGAAMLVATAFRLRDEEALIMMLRRLTNAVDGLSRDDAPARRAACG